jgi:hypothetical protein
METGWIENSRVKKLDLLSMPLNMNKAAPIHGTVADNPGKIVVLSKAWDVATIRIIPRHERPSFSRRGIGRVNLNTTNNPPRRNSHTREGIRKNVGVV